MRIRYLVILFEFFQVMNFVSSRGLRILDSTHSIFDQLKTLLMYFVVCFPLTQSILCTMDEKLLQSNKAQQQDLLEQVRPLV